MTRHLQHHSDLQMQPLVLFMSLYTKYTSSLQSSSDTQSSGIWILSFGSSFFYGSVKDPRMHLFIHSGDRTNLTERSMSHPSVSSYTFQINRNRMMMISQPRASTYPYLLSRFSSELRPFGPSLIYLHREAGILILNILMHYTPPLISGTGTSFHLFLRVGLRKKGTFLGVPKLSRLTSFIISFWDPA